MYDQPIKRQLAVKIVMKAMAKSVQYDYNVESAKIKDFSNLNGRYYDTTLSAYADGILLVIQVVCLDRKVLLQEQRLVLS